MALRAYDLDQSLRLMPLTVKEDIHISSDLILQGEGRTIQLDTFIFSYSERHE